MGQYINNSTWNKEDEEFVEVFNDYVKNLDIFFSEIKIGDKNIASKEFREKVQHWLKTIKGRVQPQLKQELNEKDEKIRKELIEHCRKQAEMYYILRSAKEYSEVQSWINWLETQDEQKPTEWHSEDEQNLNVCLSYIPDEFLRRWLKDVIHIKYDKQADNIEPKFNVGDWVVSPNGVYWHIDAIRNGRYQVSAESGEIADWPLDTNIYHRFTIKDAKDGDVLASNNSIFIFSQEYIAEKPEAYCGIMNGLFIVKPKSCWTNEKCYSATKEQRNFLFQKMHESGYDWYADKKRLKEIEQEPENYKRQVMSEMTDLVKDYIKQKPAWSEEDENIKQSIIDILTRQGFQTQVNWFKDRVQPQSKQEWSENDDKIEYHSGEHTYADGWHDAINCIQKNVLRPQNNITDEELVQAKKEAYNDALNKIEYHSGEPTFDDGWSAAIWYLKKRNGRPQTIWLPSKEQLHYLYWIANIKLGDSVVEQEVSKHLNELYEDLKKLRKE